MTIPSQINDKGTILYSHDDSIGTPSHYSRYDHTAILRQPDLGSCLLSVKEYRGYFCPEEERLGAFCFSKSR
ncbi:hypothetical protein DKX38_010404 [Salix brachista]|uniref:Uncharacterized protein n=1 Tax=Salix brachista TaxID=2182728 RepID=A0A5N5MFM2_9ROSI|nr:hypothetical protein DKX38_010404 [Salix brachista]